MLKNVIMIVLHVKIGIVCIILAKSTLIMNKYLKAVIRLERVYISLRYCNEKFCCRYCYYRKYGSRCIMKLQQDMLIILRGLYGCNNNSKERGRSNDS